MASHEAYVHPLGRVKTTTLNPGGTVAEFRGIPYGVVTKRFRRPKPIEEWPEPYLDASHYGPRCPAPLQAAAFNLAGATPSAQKNVPLVEEDEFKCLNLNVTVPIGHPKHRLYPVAVSTHGCGHFRPLEKGCVPSIYDEKALINPSGANCFSSANVASLSGTPLVEQSVRLGQPIVFITLNYRLGAFGFLAAENLRVDNCEIGDEGCGNYGIHDQIMALRWVQRYVTSFSGDPSRVTVMGESAGASDLHIQLLSNETRSETLFTQVGLFSGNAVIASRSLEQQSERYRKLINHLSIDSNLPGHERLQRLREVEADELTAAYICTGSALPNWQATVDGFLLRDAPKASNLKNVTYPDHIKRLLVGVCQREAIIWLPRIRAAGWTPGSVRAVFASAFDDHTTDELLQAYSLDAVDLDPEMFFMNLETFCNDAEFIMPLYEVLRGWKNGDALCYHMRFPNPFDSPFKGTAHHAVDTLFLFQTFNDMLPVNQRAGAEKLGQQLIAFIHGEACWTTHDRGGKAMCFGPEDHREQSEDEDTVARYKTWRKFAAVLDTMTHVSRVLRGEVALH